MPPNAGVGSALGFFTAPRAFDLVRSHKVPVASADFAALEKLFRELERQGEQTLRKAGAGEEVGFARAVEARFIGQGSETRLAIPERDFAKLDPAELRRRFDAEYTRLYGRTYAEAPVEIVNLCVRASLPVKLLNLPKLGLQSNEGARKGKRSAYSGIARDFIPYTVYDRYKLAPGTSFPGPAIVEERESTVIVGEDASATVDDYGFLWIEFGHGR